MCGRRSQWWASNTKRAQLHRRCSIRFILTIRWSRWSGLHACTGFGVVHARKNRTVSVNASKLILDACDKFGLEG